MTRPAAARDGLGPVLAERDADAAVTALYAAQSAPTPAFMIVAD